MLAMHRSQSVEYVEVPSLRRRGIGFRIIIGRGAKETASRLDRRIA
jgi:hypothetical protein